MTQCRSTCTPRGTSTCEGVEDLHHLCCDSPRCGGGSVAIHAAKETSFEIFLACHVRAMAVVSEKRRSKIFFCTAVFSWKLYNWRGLDLYLHRTPLDTVSKGIDLLSIQFRPNFDSFPEVLEFPSRYCQIFVTMDLFNHPTANSSLRYVPRSRKDFEEQKAAALEQCLKDKQLHDQIVGRSSVVRHFHGLLISSVVFSLIFLVCIT